MLAILALALALRLTGIGFGMPFWIANDEQPLIGGALRMLELRNPVPSLNPGPMTILYYPPGIPYLYLVFFLPYLAVDWFLAGMPGAEAFAQRLISDLTGPWLIARALSAVMGALTACVIARLTAEVFDDRRAGIVAGLLFAVSFHHVLIGHFARVWPPTVLLFWWGLWGAWRVHARGRRIDYVHAALGAGLGFACNYVGVLVSIGVAWAHVARHRAIVVDRLVLLHAAIVAFFIVLFGALYWQNLLRLVGFSPLLAEATGLQSRGQRVPIMEMLPHYGGIFATGDPTYAIAGAACLVWFLWRRPLVTLAALVTVACYLAVIFTGTVDDDRYILPATPLLMIAIAGVVAAMARRVPAAAGALALAIMLPPLAASIQLDRLMLRPDTREIARARVLEQAAPGEGIANAMRAVTLEPSVDALRIQERIEPSGMSAAQRRKLAGQAILAGGGGREVPAVTAVLQRGTEDPGFGARLHDELLAAGYRWYLTDDFFDDARRRPLDPIVRARGERVARIAPSADGSYGPIFNLANQFERTRFLDVFRVEHLGPTVEIWRMR